MEGREKDVTGVMNAHQRIPPAYTGGGVNHRRYCGRNEGPGHGRPPFTGL